MISILKKANKHVRYVAVGIAVCFSLLKDLLSVSVAASYSTGTSFSALVLFVMLLSVAMFAVLARVLVYVSFRICGAIFTKKSGMLYPFPIGFREFASGKAANMLWVSLISECARSSRMDSLTENSAYI